MGGSLGQIFESSVFGGVPEAVEGGYDLARDGAGWARDSFNNSSRSTQQLIAGTVAFVAAMLGTSMIAGSLKFPDPVTGEETSMAGTWQASLAKLLVGAVAVFWATSDLNPLIRKSGEADPSAPPPGDPRMDRDGDGYIDADYARGPSGQILNGMW